MTTTNPRPTARPKAQPPEPRKPRAKKFARALRDKLKIRVLREQDDYAEEAQALAAQLGWEGAPEDILFDIKIKDAQAYLRKVLHEVHLAALNPDSERVKRPTAEAVCQHLGLDESYLDEVREALERAFERETPQPTTPLS